MDHSVLLLVNAEINFMLGLLSAAFVSRSGRSQQNAL
jgi:hypothetical protein